jgi:hypothetical protein
MIGVNLELTVAVLLVYCWEAQLNIDRQICPIESMCQLRQEIGQDRGSAHVPLTNDSDTISKTKSRSHSGSHRFNITDAIPEEAGQGVRAKGGEG